MDTSIDVTDPPEPATLPVINVSSTPIKGKDKGIAVMQLSPQLPT